MRRRNNQLELGCDAHGVAVDYRRNSLAVQGSIRLLKQDAPSEDVRDQRVHVRAVTLKPVLSNIPTDGSLVQVGPKVFVRCGYSGILSTRPCSLLGNSCGGEQPSSRESAKIGI